MEKEFGNNWIGIIIVALIIWGGYSIFHKDDVSDLYESYGYENESGECLFPENPYGYYEEGHHAGFEWAMQNDVGSCGGNSQSFIEGCEEYVTQMVLYEECENS